MRINKIAKVFLLFIIVWFSWANNTYAYLDPESGSEMFMRKRQAVFV